MPPNPRNPSRTSPRQSHAASSGHTVPLDEGQLTRLAALLGDAAGASQYIPEEERKELEQAQRSVVNARRQADLNEGHLRVY
jgi:hypothetical protein